MMNYHKVDDHLEMLVGSLVLQGKSVNWEKNGCQIYLKDDQEYCQLYLQMDHLDSC